MTIFRLLAALGLALASHAFAAVDFGVHEFAPSEFNDAADVFAACDADGADSFWCALEDASLTRIPTKGVDLFFTPVGEVVGAYGKHQKGQNIRNYNLDARQNLITPTASIPGAAVLVDGDYLAPTNVEGDWTRVDEVTLEGEFTFEAGPWRVARTVRVRNTSHTLDLEVEVTRADGAGEAAAADDDDEDEVPVQVAFPGISNVDDPVIKVGQGVGEAGNFSLNPVSQAVPDPSYVSLQSNNRNTAFAIVLRPAPSVQTDGLVALPMPPDQVALQRGLAPDASSITLRLQAYLGPNELVRYDQEGYLDLPGLFDPNILGRLSMGILWVLKSIHDVVGSWGLSIIVLTLLFRLMIWPLISTQTKSMFGMQKLQPKIQELQKKYKDDRQTLTQETMKLYKEYGVNPAGGCLPILAQMPLFIILWRVFVNFEFSEGFLWVPDLGQSDPYFILPILYVCVMFGMSYFSARGNPQSMRQQIIINLVFAFILFGFPAGVLLYFVVSMGVQVFQYWLIQRDSSAAPVPVAAAAGAGDGKGTIEVESAGGSEAEASTDEASGDADADGDPGGAAQAKAKGTSNRRGPAKKKRGSSGKGRGKGKRGGS